MKARRSRPGRPTRTTDSDEVVHASDAPALCVPPRALPRPDAARAHPWRRIRRRRPGAGPRPGDGDASVPPPDALRTCREWRTVCAAAGSAGTREGVGADGKFDQEGQFDQKGRFDQKNEV